ncbi:MAG: lamin tail domain-containing protein, partial [Candidatus Micrarchaeota archaeon]|nr:lamin tail domain-containing protein [Candidatus Micrarchaeota archaeon]
MNEFTILLFSLPPMANAAVFINEILYDFQDGADTGREWVEVINTGEAVDISGWKFVEANTNHGLTLVQGSVEIPSGGFAMIVIDAAKFLADWPGFSGTIFDSSFSLSNTGETL